MRRSYMSLTFSIAVDPIKKKKEAIVLRHKLRKRRTQYLFCPLSYQAAKSRIHVVKNLFSSGHCSHGESGEIQNCIDAQIWHLEPHSSSFGLSDYMDDCGVAVGVVELGCLV